MKPPQTAVHPGLVVAVHLPAIARQQRKLIGWIPVAKNRTQLTPAQVLVLAELLSQGPRTTLPAAAEADLGVLTRLGFCVDGGDGKAVRYPPRKANIVTRDDGPASAAALPVRLELPWNFAMRPGPFGFYAFCTARREYALLPPPAVATLLAFFNVANTDGLDPDLAPWAAWLFACGLLVEPAPERTPRTVTTRLAEVRAACATDRATLPDQMAKVSGLVERGAHRNDGRTPVYFVSVSMDIDSRTHIPLGLGMVLAQVKHHEGGLLAEAFRLIPDILSSPAAVVRAVEQHGPGIVFFSDMLWTQKAHLAISKALKAASHDFVTVHGGSSVPMGDAESRAFLSRHEHVDIAVRGEGELTAAELLAAFAPTSGKPGVPYAALREVRGLTFRDPSAPSGITRTEDRPLIQDLNRLPSPYLTGVFDGLRPDETWASVLESNRGCPYRCAYCSWSIGSHEQKFRLFDLDRVRAEIEWAGSHKIPVIWGADSNFGILPRDLEIAKMIGETRHKYGFPRQIMVNYAKNSTARIAEIVRVLRDAGVSADALVAMQTTDPTTLSIVNRSNIKTSKYDELIDAFRDLRLPASTDLLIGLPGSTPDSFARDLQHCFDRRIPAKAYLTRMLVNSPMAEASYREKYRIETDENDFIVATFSYTRDDRQAMSRLYDAYRLYEASGVLYYVLRYLQWEHGILAADFLRQLVHVLDTEDHPYSAIAWVDRFWSWNFNPGGFRPFYEDLTRYLEERYGIGSSSGLDAVLRFQEAVIREPFRVLPETIRLDHDIVTWFQDRLAGNGTGAPLHSYPRAELVVSDPEGLCQVDLSRNRSYDFHFVRWELLSPLRSADAVSVFYDFG